MKEIEERAAKYAEQVPYDGTNNFYDDADYKAAEESYIAGATEQKKIDIDKACIWLKDNLPTQDAAHYNYNYEEMFNDFVDDFRKAMEE